MRGAPPSHYDDLEGSLSVARSLLVDGSKDRKSAAHHPVVATVDERQIPRQRVMILRACDWDQRILRFHTDARSAKVSELDGRLHASVLVYDEEKKIQLRLSGQAGCQAGIIADQAWRESTLFARRCYMAENAPGQVSGTPTSGLPEWIEGRQPEEEQIAPARANFAVILFHFDELEWLYLANSGHRRARWRWDMEKNLWQGTWLVP